MMGNSSLAVVWGTIAGSDSGYTMVLGSNMLLQDNRYWRQASKEATSPTLASTDTAVPYSPTLIFFSRLTRSLEGPISIKWVLPET